MKQDGHTVLLTTHYMEEAESLCDRVAVIDKGRVVGTGRTADLIASSSTEPSVSLTTSRPLEREPVDQIPGLSDLQHDGATIRFRAKHVTRTLADLVKLLETQQVDILELHIQRASLEDVFLEMTSLPGNDGTAT
jgi:ABC-2 type transport system ATP-binding protein